VVTIRPHHLPQELSLVMAKAGYITPSANAEAACVVLHSVVSRLQTQHPQALLLISEDFNNVSPFSTLPTFTQYVTCHTRDNKTLDQFCSNISETHSSPLGRSDHNLIHCLPVNKPMSSQVKFICIAHFMYKTIQSALHKIKAL